MRLLIVLALIAALIMGAVGTVDAAKGGKGKGKHAMEATATLTDPTLVISPTPPLTAWGQEYRVDGEGYEPGAVYIVASEPYPWAFWTVWPDEDSQISWVRDTGQPGTYILDAYQRNGGGVLYLQGHVEFEVLPAE